MTSELNHADDKDALLNDLLQETEELKEVSRTQGERLNHLEQGQKEFIQKIEELYDGFSGRIETLLASQKSMDLSLLTSILKIGLEDIKEEVKKQHCQLYETKHYSLFGDRFGSEHFKTVMDTAMKWVIVLLVSLNIIAMIKFLIHFE